MSDRKAVLFDRALRPDWIDFALERSLSSDDETALRAELKEWLARRLEGVYTVEKTARQLLRTVGPSSPLSRVRLQRDYERMRLLSPDERNSIRLALISDASGFFTDCCGAIRALNLNGEETVTLAQLYERLQGEYGHRGMIPRRVRYVLQTLASFGCLENASRSWRTVPDSWLAEF